jgi:hypothetical protein
MLSEPESLWRRPEVRRHQIYAKRLRSFLAPLLTMRSREGSLPFLLLRLFQGRDPWRTRGLGARRRFTYARRRRSFLFACALNRSRRVDHPSPALVSSFTAYALPAH